MENNSDFTLAVGPYRYKDGKWLEWRTLTAEEKDERFDPELYAKLEKRSNFTMAVSFVCSLIAVCSATAVIVIKDVEDMLLPTVAVSTSVGVASLSVLWSAQTNKKLLEREAPYLMEVPPEEVNALMLEHREVLEASGLTVRVDKDE